MYASVSWAREAAPSGGYGKADAYHQQLILLTGEDSCLTSGAAAQAKVHTPLIQIKVDIITFFQID